MILLAEEVVVTENEEGRQDPVLEWIEENFGPDNGTMGLKKDPQR